MASITDLIFEQQSVHVSKDGIYQVYAKYVPSSIIDSLPDDYRYDQYIVEFSEMVVVKVEGFFGISDLKQVFYLGLDSFELRVFLEEVGEQTCWYDDFGLYVGTPKDLVPLIFDRRQQYLSSHGNYSIFTDYKQLVGLDFPVPATDGEICFTLDFPLNSPCVLQIEGEDVFHTERLSWGQAVLLIEKIHTMTTWSDSYGMRV